MIAPGLYEARSLIGDGHAYVVVHEPVVTADSTLVRRLAELERDLREARRALERYEL